MAASSPSPEISLPSCCALPPRGQQGLAPKRDFTWLKLGVAAIIAGQGMLVGLGYNDALSRGEAPAFGSPAYLVIHGALAGSALLVMALLAPPLLRLAWQHLRRGRVAVEQLFLLTMLGAFAGSVISSLSGQGSIYYEVVAVVLAVYTLGRQLSVRQQREVLQAVERLREDYAFAWVLGDNGGRHRVLVAALVAGQGRVSVAPGEVFPVDGRILEGRGYVQEATLTGEPHPRPCQAGDAVQAGTYALDGEFIVRPERVLGQRAVDAVLALVATPSAAPSRLQVQADRLMGWFLPLVTGASLATFLGWLTLSSVPWWEALFNAMAVLLVACPCALGLATPVAVWGALLSLGRLGLVVRHASLIDVLAEARLVLFDKTGTLSEGTLEGQRLAMLPGTAVDEAWLRRAVASLESRVNHPLARTLAGLGAPDLPVREAQVHPGEGVSGYVEGRLLRVGEGAFAAPDLPPMPGKHVVVSVDGQAVAQVNLQERWRPFTMALLAELRTLGVRSRVLTGDRHPVRDLPPEVEVSGGLSPEEKAREVCQRVEAGEKFLFVGDGLNDAGALRHSPGSLAVAEGPELARAAADAVVPGDKLAALPTAVRLARRVNSGLRSNLRLAVGYNLIGISLAAAGLLHPVVAALLMVVSSALVSTRALASAHLRPEAGTPR